MAVRFGPAGNGELFSKEGYKHTEQAPEWLAGMGLDAYEYQCGRGVNISTETAERIGAQANLHGIALSVHSPYFINLSNPDEERRQKNIGYVMETCRAAKAMGAERIVVHCGGLSKMTREQAGANTDEAIKQILDAVEQSEYSNIRICLETMGKINVYGTLEEVCALCAKYEKLLPCIDFGHLNARTLGGLATLGDFERLFDIMENMIGTDKAHIFHGHFSKIEYSKGGEVKHLTFADEKFGPKYEYVAEILAKRNYSGTVICESSGTQAEDALTMKQAYQQYISR